MTPGVSGTPLNEASSRETIDSDGILWWDKQHTLCGERDIRQTPPKLRTMYNIVDESPSIIQHCGVFQDHQMSMINNPRIGQVNFELASTCCSVVSASPSHLEMCYHQVTHIAGSHHQLSADS
jgi:hypothetical protein